MEYVDEIQYLNMVHQILNYGEDRDDRTGIGTKALFGCQMRFNLKEGFPLLTTKKMPIKTIATELLWFLRGETNVKWLQDRGVHIWDEWADEDGELGPVYGSQWRSWQAPDGRRIDQISQLINGLRSNPFSRRHIINSWNVGELDAMALPPCHLLTQFFVSKSSELTCIMYQRSCDVFLGVPFNIASYALLTHLVAKTVDLVPKEFIWVGGDCHLYKNHLLQADLLLRRKPYPPPSLVIDRKGTPDLMSYEPSNFKLYGYKFHPKIPAPIAV